MNRNEKLAKIKNYLSEVERSIEFDTRANLFDINKHCENFYCGLLNIIYGLSLKNANVERKNYISVDLIDKNNKIYIQVTSTNTRNKVQSTIDKFIKKEFYKDSKLKILIICGKKEKFKKKFNTQQKFIFDCSKDIIDNKDLYSRIKNLDIEKIDQVLEYLKSEIDAKYKFINLNTFSKIDKIETCFFSERLIYKASDYEKDGYFSSYKALKIETVLEINNRIVIIGDAGTGKSEICKNVVNTINSHKNCFAFYFDLLNYTGEEIENLKPSLYKDLPNEYITFVLDGYDEIINSQKQIFIKKIQKFIWENKKVKIIITSRTNFYKFGNKNNTISEFEPYYLLDFNDKNIKDVAKNYGVNFDDLIFDIRKNNLGYTMTNPFYAVFLISYYVTHNCLLTKENLIPKIVQESFNNDVKKFNTTKDLEDVKERMFKILKLLSFSMALFERNYLTNEEFLQLIKNEDDRKLLDYSSLWKNKNNKLMFSHNNFYEYFAAEQMKKLDYNKIKELITYDEITFNPNWMNIVVFMLNKKYNESFINWLLIVYPDFIFYLEKDKISQSRREELFISTFENYEKKKIWLPNEIYYNNRFAEFIYSERVVEYLIFKLDSNMHYTVVYNALNLLSQFKSFGRLAINLKKVLIKLICSNKFKTSQKRIALNILSDNMLIDDTELDEIIKINKINEDPYLRTAYYYHLNKNGINEQNINILFDRLNSSRFKSVSRWSDSDDDEINLYDEYFEFNKLFSNIKDEKFLKLLLKKIEELQKRDCKELLSEEIIKNICQSIGELNLEKEKKLDLLLKLYLIVDANYLSRDSNIIVKFLSEAQLRLDFFKKVLRLKRRISFISMNCLVDEKCLEYFYNQYNMGCFSDDLAYIILCEAGNTNNINYIQINNLYYKRTGINFLEERKKLANHKETKGKSVQDYFDSIFNKEEFFLNLKDYLKHLHLKDPSKLEKSEIKKIDDEFYDDNDKYNYIIEFLRRFDRKSDCILIEDLEKIDWDYFILTESYNILILNNDITISSQQKEKINCICQKYLNKISFRNAIKYKNDGSSSTSYLSVYLWAMKYRLNLQYSEDVLLDMLSFEWGYIDGKTVGINYIIEAIPEYKVRNRIIDNIKTKKMYGAVLKNHVNYCIEHDINDLSEYFIKYLIEKKLTYYDKQEIIEYIIKFYPKKLIKNNLLDMVDFETRIHLIDKIYNVDKEFILDYVEIKCRNAKKINNKIIYLKYLVKSGNLYGLEKYYKLLKKKMSCVDLENCYQNTIIDALSQVENIKCLDIISKIYLLTYSPNFKDNKFESVYSGCKEAFIKMALSNIKQNSHLLVIKSLQDIIDENIDINNIGFTYYIIDEIKTRVCFLTKKQYNIQQVINMVNNLFINNESTGLKY